MWHRKSVDLDFAVPRFVSNKDIEVFKKVSKRFEIVYQSKEQINMFVDYVKVTVFSYFYKNHFTVQKYKNLKIRDLKDIAFQLTISRREGLKDHLICISPKKYEFRWNDQVKISMRIFKKLFLKRLPVNEVECEIKYLEIQLFQK